MALLRWHMLQYLPCIDNGGCIADASKWSKKCVKLRHPIVKKIFKIFRVIGTPELSTD